MDIKFIEAWEENKHIIKKRFEENHPQNYKEIVYSVVRMLNDFVRDSTKPDPERIHEIDDGDYQGDLVYVIGEEGYQPNEYWYVKISYGSCGGCDTLQKILDFSDDAKPNKQQVEDYMTLALHILQGLKKMGDSVG